MIIERVNGCDCPLGNFTCEVFGCFRRIRSPDDLQRDSDEALERRAEEPQP